MKRALVVVASILTLPSVVWSQTPVGSEFQVNSYTTFLQRYASVAGDAAGNFVVVWTDFGQSYYSVVLGQRYDRDGNPLGGEFEVNSFTTGYQFQGDVAMAPDGSFVVAWNNYIYPYGATGVYGQRFASDGSPLGGEFQVNSYAYYLPYYPRPRVAADGSGDFVVVWNSFLDGSYYGISGQPFSSGAPVGSEFVVNTYTTGSQSGPSVAMDPAGNFVVTWLGPGDGNSSGIFGQRFGNDGAPQGGEFQANSYTTSNQFYPSVSMDTDGDFVVTWSGPGDGGSFGTFGQRFGNDGAPQGGEFQANSYTTGYQLNPSVSMDTDGNFVVTWHGPGDGSAYGIFAQQFSSDGTPEGAEFQVNTYTSGYQAYPVVAAGADGDFVVVWNDLSGQDGSSFGIFGQRFNGPGFTGNAPTIGLTVNQTSFTTGNTLNVGASVNNPGSAITDEAFIAALLTAADFYFGALLPDGDTIVFVTDFATLTTGVGTLSDLSTLSPLTVGEGFDLAGAFTFNDPNLLSFTFTGAEASGAYTLFLAAVLPGGFADGVADAGDIIALGTADFAFAP